MLYSRAYIFFSLLLLLTVYVFWNNFFMQLGDSGLGGQLHGWTAVAWMLMLIGQSWSASQRKFPLHRRLGKLVYVLAPLFVLGGLAVIYTMVADVDDKFYASWGKKLAFYDATSTLYFAAAVTMALVNKKKMDLHARWMVSTVVPLFLPIFTRFNLVYMIPGVGFGDAVMIGFVVSLLLILWMIWRDWRSGKIYAPWLWALGLVLVQMTLINSVHEHGWWIAITDAYASLPMGWLY